MKIKLVYTPAENGISILDLDIKAGATIQEAIEMSGISEKYSEVDFNKCKTGVYSQPKARDYVLKDNDRLEIYRPLDAAQRKFAKERQ